MIITVVGLGEGKEELTVWDHKESEFSSGLEYIRVYEWVLRYSCAFL